MPQIKVEYSSNIAPVDFQEFFKEINLAIVDTLGTGLAKCKAKAQKFDTFCIGDGDPDNSFVFVDVLYLEGRTPQMQQDCASKIQGIIKQYFSSVLEDPKGQVTLHLHEMDKARYFEIE